MRIRDCLCSFALALLGCGGGAPEPAQVLDVDAGPTPLVGDLESWTWVPIEGAFCADGSPTGVAVNLTQRSPNVVLFLMGGGACWDYASCYQSSTATYIAQGFGESDMPYLTLMTTLVGLLNRDDPTNPFRDDSVVSMPYCTGDAFTGDHTATYQGKPTMHVGHANVMASLPHIVATFPSAERVFLVGVSAGGIGAAFNWWHVDDAFNAGGTGAARKVRVDMIDDSGPALPAPYLMPSLVEKWQASWDLNAALPSDCTTCTTALDALIPWSAAKMPNSRGALLEYTADGVFPAFLGISTAEFGKGLTALATQRLDALPRFHYFYDDGSSHVLMPHQELSQNGVHLWDCISEMVTDDSHWASVHP